MGRRPVLAQIRIPAGLRFADLKLRRHAGGDVSFDRAVVARVLEESGIPENAATEDLHGSIISGWYARYRAAGGAPDQVMEDLIAEDEEEQRAEAN
jgi:hypothetical protein